MAKTTASLPQGTRDFTADTLRKRNFILATIRTVFELYGYAPLETPALEQLDTLMGKYGEEGDKLIFKILNNGLHDPANVDKARAAFEQVMAGKNDKDLTSRALRYDLTIPFARYVAMNIGQLTLPFRRYQMQPVWRADRPQKGRYREFYQCDADVVGSYSLVNEVELVFIYSTVFNRLGIPATIKINNRKILAALAIACRAEDQLTHITMAIDKLDKIGPEKVSLELSQRGLQPGQIEFILKYLGISGPPAAMINEAEAMLGESETGRKGIEEIRFILDYVQAAGWPENAPAGKTAASLAIDFTLARGLNYYTGTIFEVKADGVRIGSIGGGGRYDDLTGTFGVAGIPGVGISFGVDRIFDVMEELQLFPASLGAGPAVLFFNGGEAESRAAFRLMQELRSNGIPAELYHEAAKADKQFKYAEKKQIGYMISLSGRDLPPGHCFIKNLVTGKQERIPVTSLVGYPY